MIHYYPEDIYISGGVDILYNPVGATDNQHGFIYKNIILYPEAYRLYQVFIDSHHPDYELLGEIQLIKVGDKRLILNGYCIDANGHINKLAFTKTLVELCNIAYEYKLSVGIEYALGVDDPVEKKWLSIIIEEVFRGVDIDVYLFNQGNDLLT